MDRFVGNIPFEVDIKRMQRAFVWVRTEDKG